MRPARLALWLLLVWALAACSPPPLYTQQAYVFGTLVEVSVYGAPAAQAQQATVAVLARFDALHRQLHAWQPSALSELNAALAQGEAATVTPELAAMLAEAQALAAQSGELFNPAIGGLVALWGFHADTPQAQVPAAAAIQAQVAARPRMADLVIVAIHWGVPSWWLSPYQGLLATYQQPLGHALIDAGAGIIFGHHSHSLHGIEVYNGAPIFYSAGNFIFERPRGFMEPESLIAKFGIGADNALDLEIVPLMVDERGLPELATGATATAVLDKLAALSEPFGTRFEREDERARLVLT